MPTKLVMDFLCNQGNVPVGWSESVVHNADDLNTAVNALYAADGYVMKRLFCLGSGVINTAARAIKLPAAGDVPIKPPKRAVRQIAGFPYQVLDGGLPYYGEADKVKVADFGQSVFMMRLQTSLLSTPVYAATKWLAALPDIGQEINRARPSAGYWLTNMEGLMTLLKNGTFLLEVNDVSGEAPFKPALAYNADTGSYTVEGHGWTTGMKVVATGFRGDPGGVLPKGIYRITKIDNDHFSLQTDRPISGVNVLGGFRRLRVAYPPIAQIAERGWRNKKKGRPSALLAGRRRAPRTSRA